MYLRKRYKYDRLATASPAEQAMYWACRRAVFNRANNRCEICGSKYKLEMHHIIPFKKCIPQLKYAASNIILLCNFDHNRLEKFCGRGQSTPAKVEQYKALYATKRIKKT